MRRKRTPRYVAGPLVRGAGLVLAALVFFVGSVVAIPVASAAGSDGYTGYLMVHFTGESTQGEQIYFSTSTDGLNWKDMNRSNPVLLSNVGMNGVRDPSIVRSPDGTRYWIIATDLRIASGLGWGVSMSGGSKNLVVWESRDLVNWSDPWLLDVAGGIPGAGNAWAPEAIWDPVQQNYLVYWATNSPVDGATRHRIWATRTTDFRTVSAPKVYIERPNTIIDTQIIEVANSKGGYRYVRASGDGQITVEGAQTLLGQWNRIGDLEPIGLTGKQVEGPILHKLNGVDQWGLWVDRYNGEGYLPLVTDDLGCTCNFRIRSSSEFNLGTNTKRHGSLLQLTPAEYGRVMAKWNNPAVDRLRSYNFPDRYWRHEGLRVGIGPVSAPVANSEFKVVPGLAGAGTVAFESLNYPGHFLRHRNFEVRLERADGSALFAADASFRQVPGLADGDWSSYQSYNQPGRYLRHYAFQLRLDPIITDTDREDATFRRSAP